MSLLVFWIYRTMLYPLAFFLTLLLKPFLNPKMKKYIRARMSTNTQNTHNPFELKNFDLWIHASSGEIEYAKPVIKKYKSLFPTKKILITYSSPSAVDFLKKMPEVDAWTPVPWDSPYFIEHFFKKYSPACFLIARTDLWPELIFQAKKRNIPSLVFSANFSSNTPRLKGFGKLLTKFSSENLTDIFFATSADKLNFQSKLNTIKGSFQGDTRYDQVIDRLRNPRELKLKLKPTLPGKTIVLGSTWPEDETVLFAAIKKVKSDIPDLKIILAPHEVDKNHIDNIKKTLNLCGFSFTSYLEAESWTSEDVLLVDTMGVLAELYSWGAVAFVGGSFRKQVHSVLEPLASGLPVIVGPFYQNSQEAIYYSTATCQGIPLVKIVNDQNEMINYLSSFFQNFSSNSDIALLRHNITTELNKNVGATDKVIYWIKDHTS